MNETLDEYDLDWWYELLEKYKESLRDIPVSTTGNYYTLKDYIFSSEEFFYDAVLNTFMMKFTFELWRNQELCDTFEHVAFVKDIFKFAKTLEE